MFWILLGTAGEPGYKAAAFLLGFVYLSGQSAKAAAFLVGVKYRQGVVLQLLCEPALVAPFAFAFFGGGNFFHFQVVVYLVGVVFILGVNLAFDYVEGGAGLGGCSCHIYAFLWVSI